MRTIRYIIQKEFIQIFRDSFMPKIIFIVPMLQLLVLSYTATFEIKKTRLAIVDQDKSEQSRELISMFDGSRFYDVAASPASLNEAERLINTRKVHQILVIPAGSGLV